jgi:hypothetical protein
METDLIPFALTLSLVFGLAIITIIPPKIQNYLKIKRAIQKLRKGGWEVISTYNPLFTGGFPFDEGREIEIQKREPDHILSGTVRPGKWYSDIEVSLEVLFEDGCDIKETWGIETFSRDFAIDLDGEDSLTLEEEVFSLLHWEARTFWKGKEDGIKKRIREDHLSRVLNRASLEELRELCFAKSAEKSGYVVKSGVYSEFYDEDIEAKDTLTPEEYISLILQKGGCHESVDQKND